MPNVRQVTTWFINWPQPSLHSETLSHKAHFCHEEVSAACHKKPRNACCLTSSASFLGRLAVDDGDSCELLLPPYGLDWMFVYVMRGFLRACKRSLLLSVFTFEPNTFHQTVMRTHVVICARLLCSSWCPILHLFCLHLKVASALIAKMRNKSTTRTVSHFSVRRCLLFTVRACPTATRVHPRGRVYTEVQHPLHLCRVLVTHVEPTPHALFK